MLVGLYPQPPDNEAVLAVDEKPHVQALERAQGWLKLPNGKALTGFSHNYQRTAPPRCSPALEARVPRTAHRLSIIVECRHILHSVLKWIHS